MLCHSKQSSQKTRNTFHRFESQQTESSSSCAIRKAQYRCSGRFSDGRNAADGIRTTRDRPSGLDHVCRCSKENEGRFGIGQESHRRDLQSEQTLSNTSIAACLSILIAFWDCQITVNFLQVVASAASINADWNTWMLSLLSTAGQDASGSDLAVLMVYVLVDFVSGAASEGIVLSIDCFFDAEQDPTRSIIRTVIYLLVPVVVLLFYIAFWLTLMWSLNENVWYFARRALLSFLVVAYLTYVSITRTAVNALYCIDVHDSMEVDVDRIDRFWAVDTSFKCYKGSHAVLATMVGWPVVIVISAGLPIALIYALIKQRSLEADKILWFSDATSFLYRAYKERFVFWESIIMFRKAILATIIVFCYPLGANIQGILALSVLTCATYVHFSCQPYKKEFDALNSYETASLIVSQLTFAAGLLFSDERTSNTAKVLLTISLSLAISGLFLFFLHKTLKTAEIYVRAVLKEEGAMEAQEGGMCRVLAAYCLSSIADSLSLLFQKPLESGDSDPQPQSGASADV